MRDKRTVIGQIAYGLAITGLTAGAFLTPITLTGGLEMPLSATETRHYTMEIPSAAERKSTAVKLLEGGLPERFPRAEAWNLILVNPWHPIPEDYTVTLQDLGNGQAVDERCYEDLEAMLSDCRAAGNSPRICSSYRTWETQQTLYQNKVKRLIRQGYSRQRAETEAAKVVALPGTSEHQLGLALDIVDQSYQILDAKQEETAVQQWLMENSWKYGFILRYPNGKSEITGIIYEPWHYRYVGRQAAEQMQELELCLEEYIQLLTGET